ncbi:MAG: hypothetical protein Q9216_004669 [Gyalolechia sp. 2 TL-2023]
MSRSGEDIPSLPPLRQHTPNLSDYTVDSSTTFFDTPSTAPTPGSPVHHRTGYRRIASFNDQDTAYHGPEPSPRPGRNLQEHGLGIKNLKPLPSPAEQSSTETSASANPLLSPPLLKSQREYKPLQATITEGHGDWEDYAPRSDPYQPFVADSETENLRKQTTAPTVQSFEPSGTDATFSHPVFWQPAR